MKFKIGDKVKVKKDLKNGYCGIHNLEDYQNDKVFTIETISIGEKSKYCYTLLEDEKEYFFREDMVIPANEEIILKAIKNEQGFYEIRMPKEIIVFSYGRTIEGYVYIDCIKKEEILDDIEKEYLRAVIKPFIDRVKYIKKHTRHEKEYIDIGMEGETILFPYFNKNTMYKGMEQNKEYTLEELGL